MGYMCSLVCVELLNSVGIGQLSLSRPLGLKPGGGKENVWSVGSEPQSMCLSFKWDEVGLELWIHVLTVYCWGMQFSPLLQFVLCFDLLSC